MMSITPATNDQEVFTLPSDTVFTYYSSQGIFLTLNNRHYYPHSVNKEIKIQSRNSYKVTQRINGKYSSQTQDTMVLKSTTTPMLPLSCSHS